MQGSQAVMTAHRPEHDPIRHPYYLHSSVIQPTIPLNQACTLLPEQTHARTHASRLEEERWNGGEDDVRGCDALHAECGFVATAAAQTYLATYLGYLV